jgi:hypothetical protein
MNVQLIMVVVTTLVPTHQEHLSVRVIMATYSILIDLLVKILMSVQLTTEVVTTIV